MKAGPTLLLLFNLLLLLPSAAAQSQQIIFNKVLPPEGIPFRHVTGIVQDKRGFIWLATKNGLFRYDGYKMVVYKNSHLDHHSLASNSLETVAVDVNGLIWVGTAGAGLDRLDPEIGIFTHFRHSPKDPASVSGDYINVVLVDHLGVLWVGTGQGLNRFDANTGKFIRYNHQPGNPRSISSNEVVTLYEDRQHVLWIGTGSVYGGTKSISEVGGLNRFDRTNGTFQRYLHDPANPRSLVNNKVKALCEDSKGNFWVGTAGDGLHIMDRSRGIFQRLPYNPANPESLSRPPISKPFAENDHITFIREDAAGAIWIGTSESGLNYYNPQNGKTIHYESGKDTVGAFTSRTTWYAYASREGVMWISSLAGELYRVNPLQRNIPFFQSSAGEVVGFYEEANRQLWLGTEKGGLFLYDTLKGVVKRYVNDTRYKASLGSDQLGSIYGDRKGNIWIGTMGAGLQLFDRENETFTSHRFHPQKNHSISNDFVLCMHEDKKGDLWIGTMRGLNRLKSRTGTFERFLFYPRDTASFGLNTISDILDSRQGDLWVGCWMMGGVQRMNPANGKFRTFLKGRSILKVFEEKDGTVWVCDIDGLNRFDRATDSFYRFQEPAASPAIINARSVAKDNHGNFWYGMPDGLLKVDVRQNMTTLYGNHYGITGDDFSYGAAYTGPYGKLYFGSRYGYFAFYPDQLASGIRPPEILFSGLRIANKIIQPIEGGPLKRPFWEAKEIRLAHNQNVFSFEFAAIDYVNPGNNRHLFMLENYDSEWRQAGNERSAYYFNVPAGRYTFRVKAANSDGIWAEKSIAVIVTPPWWRTWWAYGIYALLFIAGVYVIHRFQQQRLLARERERARVKELAQAREIERAYTELKATQAQLVQREKMASLGELTAGIAHEIQNPLNFVNNFSETNVDLLTELKQELAAHRHEEASALAEDVIANERKIVHHGKKADSIVKGMLQHARASTGEKHPTDINALVEEHMRLAYHGYRAKDQSFNADINTDFDVRVGQLSVVPQEIGRVLLNLFNNAFYAVQQKKQHLNGTFEPVVSVSTKRTGEQVIITISDNGMGIPERAREKVFQPFFTTKPTGEGTGLGLSLSYDIVTKGHGGNLSVQSREGEGSVFIVMLPTLSR